MPGARAPSRGANGEKNKHYPIFEASSTPHENASVKLWPPMQNLMFDPRVYRGSPNSKKKKFLSSELFDDSRSQMKFPRSKHVPVLANTPETKKGTKHADIQTEMYLEELTDRIPEYDVDTQTDPFLERPATPLFIPWKSGPDVATQIYEFDLFDFDTEVEPMLEVLVGRTLEQALMEFMEDRQLAHLRRHQDRFEQLRVAELIALQRMEASELRAIQEKERRIAQERKRLAKETELREQIESEMCAIRYLKQLKDEVMLALQRAGYFYDPVQRELELQFLPQMKMKMVEEMQKIITARHTLNYIIDEVTLPDYEESLASATMGLQMVMNRVGDILTSWTVFNEEVLMSIEAHDSAARQVVGTIVQNLHEAHDGVTDVLGSLTTDVDTLVQENVAATGEIMLNLIGQLETFAYLSDHPSEPLPDDSSAEPSATPPQ